MILSLILENQVYAQKALLLPFGFHNKPAPPQVCPQPASAACGTGLQDD